jgi:hypothetical protein
MENPETTRYTFCPNLCVELGETDAIYSVMLFKNPGVFNSRSSR